MGVAYSQERREARKGACDFCGIMDKIRDGHRVIYEDELVVAFNDRTPQAAKHILVVPKEHIPSCEEVTIEDAGLLDHMRAVGERLLGPAEGNRNHMGFHVPPFTSVMHLHLHCLQEPFLKASGAYSYSDWGVGFMWWRPLEELMGNLKRQPTRAELERERQEKVRGDLGETVPRETVPPPPTGPYNA